ncbi:MAG: NAD(P)H-dependent glycerol-3-phosphate dehydrogenase [Chloroflexota bacterium]
MPKIAVIGTTTWGMTLSIIFANNGLKVRLWARTEQEARKLASNGPPSNLPDAAFPSNLSITDSLSEALKGVKAVILAVPTQSMRQNIKLAREFFDDSMLLVNVAKGLEIGTNQRMSQVITEEIKPELHHNICVLSGPNLSREVLKGLPAAGVVAAVDETIARKVQKLLTTSNFCIFTNTDVIGVELGGALKNIIALGAGMADGLGYGDNAKSALITRGLTEISALGVALGASPLTFSGLAGLGDLIATCSSSLSRNHYVGVELAKGRPLQEITDSMTGIAEGISTTLVVHNLAKQMGLDMPITQAIYRVLYEDADVRKTSAELMTLGAAHELAGRKWRLFSSLRKRS